MDAKDNKNIQKNKESTRLDLSLSEDIDIISGDIEGNILGNRYLVKSFLYKGAHGLIYKVSDSKKESKTRLVVKIQEFTALGLKEIETLEQLQSMN